MSRANLFGVFCLFTASGAFFVGRIEDVAAMRAVAGRVDRYAFYRRGKFRRQRFEPYSVFVFDSRTDGRRVFNEGDIFHLIENFFHQFTRSGCPGTVFDERDGTVLQIVCFQVVKQIFHGDENAGIVSCGREHEMRRAERFGNDVGRVSYRNVVKSNVFDAVIGEATSENFGCVFGIAVHGSVSYYDGIVFGLISAPLLIFFDESCDIFAPNGTVKRTNHLNIET